MSEIKFISPDEIDNEFIDLDPEEHRTIFSDSSRRWKHKVIPYILDKSFSKKEKKAIKSAIAEITANSCFVWVKIRPVDAKGGLDYVSIEKSSVCKTHEGRLGGKQILSLSSLCCTRKGIVLHLLLHAMGIRHEHQRSDRLDYIKVNLKNVMDGRKHLFERYRPVVADSLGMEYNYRSVMHFPSTLYAKDKSTPVLSRKHCDVKTADLGDGLVRGYLTKLDLRNINILYNCSSFLEN